MATTPQTTGPEGPLPEESKNVLLALWKHMQDNPFQYIGGAAFIVAVLAFTGIYRLAADSKDRRLSSAYAVAVLIEDPAERAEALAPLAVDNTRLAPHALYLRGEALLSAREHAAAAEAFSQLRETYPDFQFVPDAVEGLGFVQEDQGNTEAALAVYREVLEKWPDTPAGRRQAFNIARCYENSGDMEEAVRFYREQFEVFPGSSVSIEAQRRLLTLRTTHPELFEDEIPAGAEQAADGQAVEPSELESSEPSELEPSELEPSELESSELESSEAEVIVEDEPETAEPSVTGTQETDPTEGDEPTPDLD